jgi:predicted alpha/beta hydrolase
MRIYLELIEVLPEGSPEEADFIRIDVTDWSKEDVDVAVQLLREHAKVYDHYVLQIHYCGHEEGGPCSVSVIESK